MDAYSRYGVAKGTVLTAWRLLRCNPLPLIGGSGYEPASWPPPHAPGWLFAAPGSPEVAVIVGAAAFLRLAHALLFE
jgi:Putative membrane protein insertion efficiency factor